MKRAAFRLVAFIVSFQLVIVSATLAGCFITKNEKCDGNNISEFMTYVVAQAFALYAAEK